MNTTQHNIPPNATAAGAEPPPVPPTPAPSVVGKAEVEQQTGGVTAGVYLANANFNAPVTLNTTLADMSLLASREPALPVSFHVPAVNPVFTGREQELAEAYALLRADAPTPPSAWCALTGMAGTGKSQLAAAYAQRHGHEYAHVFWVVGASPEQLASQLAGLAEELHLPLPPNSTQDTQLQATQQWFAAHDNWLLVVDNAEQLTGLKPMLPLNPAGRILLTTRETVPANFARSVLVAHLDDLTGALLLLRRAQLLTPEQALDASTPEAQADAIAVSRLVGGLPLALDQAGAYIAQRGITPATYMQHYQQRRQTLHRRYDNPDHASVAVTFDLALKQVAADVDFGAAAAELAHVCAFCASDVVPDEVFTLGASALDPALAPFAANAVDFADVCETAGRHALLRHQPDPPGLWMHRLTQEVLRDSLSAEERARLVQHVVDAVALAFPEPQHSLWPLCERLLSHALLCASSIQESGIRTPAASQLLDRMGKYLQQRARYYEAEPLFRAALSLDKALKGEEHPDVGAMLHNLGALCQQMGRMEEALALYTEANEICRKTFGVDHPNFATSLDNIAELYYAQRNFTEAAKLRIRALEITRKALGENSSLVAVRLNNLANAFVEMKLYSQAEELLLQAMHIIMVSPDIQPPEYATTLMNVAALYLRWGRYDTAAPMLHQALTLLEQIHGKNHPEVASCHFKLGFLCYKQHDNATAAKHFHDALDIQERIFMPNHPAILNTRNALAKVEVA